MSQSPSTSGQFAAEFPETAEILERLEGGDLPTGEHEPVGDEPTGEHEAIK